jgi:ubiquinone/menaquinone biosynthesis C-methylase UbiE
MEKRRYLEHNNNVNDPGYQQFVAPIVNEVIKNHSPGEKGLDYGSGTGPVISKLLKDQDHNIITYDPIFEKKLGILDKTYDYIVCCEVIEHFHNPVEEFQGLRRILKPGGKLYCMTYLFSEDIDFKTWNYKDDQTHVIIYHANAIKWMNNNFGFREYTINGRLIIFHG